MNMKVKIYCTVILILISFQTDFRCPSFSSGELGPNICASKIFDITTNGYSWKFAKCNLSQFCNLDLSQQNSSCKDKANPTNLLPGENCTTDVSCYSGSCKSGFCDGKPIQASCSSDIECNVGFYCSGVAGNKACSPLLSIGSSCNAKTSKCVGNAICSNNTCKKMQSIEIGQISDNYLLCKSGYTVLADINEGIPRCQEPTILTNPSRNCSLGEMCNYQSGNIIKSIPCRCGVNPNGFGNCANGTKDLAGYLEAFLNFTNKIWQTPQCHINSPFFCLNVQNIPGYNESYVGFQLFHDSILLNNDTQDNTVKSVLRPDFWTAYDNIPKPNPPNNSFNFGLLVSLLLILLIFI